jgi:hypothetical protein
MWLAGRAGWRDAVARGGVVAGLVLPGVRIKMSEQFGAVVCLVVCLVVRVASVMVILFRNHPMTFCTQKIRQAPSKPGTSNINQVFTLSKTNLSSTKV